MEHQIRHSKEEECLGSQMMCHYPMPLYLALFIKIRDYMGW